MISIIIDDFEFLTKPQISILEACKHAGINIPRFCYHETLSIAGNCRMCLVEIENAEKPVASCVTEVEEGMSILTNSAFVKKARENVVETLLLNHPLDCPICDQAGECDLQDQTKKFGSPFSRFFFKKKGVEDKYCGPLIKTIMTRCITCTRCVRYSTEIAGEDFFGTLNRGKNTEISSYTPKFFQSEISANVIDLCPVGALTSQPYAFKARPWELRVSESIDFTDSLGSNIYVNYKETDISRILPKSNKNLNENIISDKGRYNYDANSLNRIVDLFENKKGFNKIKWREFFKSFSDDLNKNNLNIHINEKTDISTLLLLKKLSYIFPKKFKISTNDFNNSSNIFVSLNNNINLAIESTSDVILFLGTNPKIESSVLNSKIRFKAKNEIIDILSFGLNYDYNYKLCYINLNISEFLNNNFNGKNKKINSLLFKSQKPLIVLGDSYSERINEIYTIKNFLKTIFPGGNIIELKSKLNQNVSKVFDVKKNTNKISKNTIFFNSLIDDIIPNRKFLKDKNFIWHHTHGSYLTLKAKYILPAVSFFETDGIFFNLENRPQNSQKTINFYKNCKKLKNLVRSLFNVEQTNYKKLEFINEFIENKEKYLELKKTNIMNKLAQNLSKNITTKIYLYPMFIKNKNFYLSDTFTRNSEILNECSIELKKNYKNFN